jgi:hypothetical protein
MADLSQSLESRLEKLLSNSDPVDFSTTLISNSPLIDKTNTLFTLQSPCCLSSAYSPVPFSKRKASELRPVPLRYDITCDRMLNYEHFSPKYPDSKKKKLGNSRFNPTLLTPGGKDLRTTPKFEYVKDEGLKLISQSPLYGIEKEIKEISPLKRPLSPYKTAEGGAVEHSAKRMKFHAMKSPNTNLPLIKGRYENYSRPGQEIISPQQLKEKLARLRIQQV